MFEPELPIHTDRLTLRPFEVADLPAYRAYITRPDVHRFLYTEPFDDVGARTRLEKKATRTALRQGGDSICLAVQRRDTGEVIGDTVLVWTSEQHRQAEIGYVFHPDHGGHGFATEAAAVMLRLGYELGSHRVCARLDGRNTASARVAERLGMRKEAHLVQNELVKGEWSDEVIYAMLASEFRDRATWHRAADDGVTG